MRKLFYLFPVVLVIVILSKGCNYQNPMDSNLQNPVPTEMNLGPIDSGMYSIHLGEIFEAPLITSNNVRIGVLKVWFDTLKFYFKYFADSAYSLKNLHLDYECIRSWIPHTGNCPNIEQFKKQVHNLPINTMTYLFTIPMASIEIPSHTIYVCSQIEYENRTLDPKCLIAWAKGVPFFNCTQFSRYFGLRYIFKPNG